MRWVYTSGAAVVAAVLAAGAWFTIDFELAANIALILIAVLVTAFTVIYGVWARWRANRVGQVFFTKCVFLSLVLWQAVVAVWWGADYPFRHEIRYAIYSLGVVAYSPMLWTLVTILRRDRRVDRAQL